MDTIRETITSEINKKIKGRESELLMKIWIDEIKDIIGNFEKLKKLHPKEFSLQLKEISETIEIFKQKVMVQ
jgi:hypothetical protein